MYVLPRYAYTASICLISPVCIICLYVFPRYAYTAVVDGRILQWEVQKLTIVREISLKDIGCLRSVQCQGNEIWCGQYSLFFQYYITKVRGIMDLLLLVGITGLKYDGKEWTNWFWYNTIFVVHLSDNSFHK
jgi:hypothetical protein